MLAPGPPLMLLYACSPHLEPLVVDLDRSRLQICNGKQQWHFSFDPTNHISIHKKPRVVIGRTRNAVRSRSISSRRAG